MRKIRLCEIEGCEKKHLAKGLCSLHYQEMMRALPKDRELTKFASSMTRNELGHKLCSGCKNWKPESDFNNNKTYRDGLHSTCKECDRDRQRLRMYQLTPEQYRAMLEAQGGTCAFPDCNVSESLAVDHDHSCCPGEKSCGKCVRSLLCGRHNKALGLFKDDIEDMQFAMQYLLSFRSVLA